MTILIPGITEEAKKIVDFFMKISVEQNIPTSLHFLNRRLISKGHKTDVCIYYLLDSF